MEDRTISPTREEPLDSDEDLLEESGDTITGTREGTSLHPEWNSGNRTKPRAERKSQANNAKIHQDFACAVLRSDVPRE